jgi:AGCS family alanine or glycine:cation symporter
METIEFWLLRIENWIWGAPLLILLTIVGLFLTIALRGVQFRYLFYSLKLAFSRQDRQAEGDISQFQALMTALAGMIGIGSITGVATAIAVGGLGSLFWMWIASLIGMATKYAEAILAVKYRTTDEKGEMCGGPMYYLERGLRSKKLALFFAIVGAITALGTGNMVQANSIAAGIKEWVPIDSFSIGIVLSLLTGFALFGGIKRIGKVSSWLVPFMALFYILSGLLVIALRVDLLPQAFLEILKQGLSGKAAFGGFAGASVMMAVQYGVSRTVFSTEAGLGSAPIAAAAAKTDVPARQALISMSGVFITSMIVCTITGLAIAVSGLFGSLDAEGIPLSGSSLAYLSFESILPHGGLIVTLSLILFGYTTILGWAYYGEKCVEYLWGRRVIHAYRILFILFLIPGATLSLQTVWSFANIMNGLMAFPNLVALFGLSAVVISETRFFDDLLKFERQQPAKTKIN